MPAFFYNRLSMDQHSTEATTPKTMSNKAEVLDPQLDAAPVVTPSPKMDPITFYNGDQEIIIHPFQGKHVKNAMNASIKGELSGNFWHYLLPEITTFDGTKYGVEDYLDNVDKSIHDGLAEAAAGVIEEGKLPSGRDVKLLKSTLRMEAEASRLANKGKQDLITLQLMKRTLINGKLLNYYDMLTLPGPDYIAIFVETRSSDNEGNGLRRKK